MKRIHYIVASWTILLSACAGFTSCDKNSDDDLGTENNEVPSDKTESDTSVSLSFDFTKSSIDAMIERCKSGNIVREDKDNLFAFYDGVLKVFKYQNDKLVSIANCRCYEDSVKAWQAYNDAKAPLLPNTTVDLVDTYVVLTSTDSDVLAPFKDFSIVQLETYIPIYLKAIGDDDNEGDIIYPKLSPAEASLFCSSPGDYVMSGYNMLYANNNDTLKSYQFLNDKIASISTYADYGTKELAEGAYENALLTSRDLGEWSVDSTFLVVTTTDADILRPFLNMTIDELADSFESSKK